MIATLASFYITCTLIATLFVFAALILNTRGRK
jgi:hypothetical protein